MKRKSLIIIIAVVLLMALCIGIAIYLHYKSHSFSTEGMTPLEIEYYSEMTASERKRAIKITVIDSSDVALVHVIKDGVDSEAVYVMDYKAYKGNDSVGPGEKLIVVLDKPFDPDESTFSAEKLFWLVIT
ncbi:MAG: hypothetical protein IJL71_04455 [Oscillospiraceae bacterium]|nr:hypothetical protein [Oscillospiraceae bacterium]